MDSKNNDDVILNEFVNLWENGGSGEDALHEFLFILLGLKQYNLVLLISEKLMHEISKDENCCEEDIAYFQRLIKACNK